LLVYTRQVDLKVTRLENAGRTLQAGSIFGPHSNTYITAKYSKCQTSFYSMRPQCRSFHSLRSV